MKNFVQPGDVGTVTASADGVTSGDLIATATSPGSIRSARPMKATGTLAAMVRLDGVAVVAAGA